MGGELAMVCRFVWTGLGRCGACRRWIGALFLSVLLSEVECEGEAAEMDGYDDRCGVAAVAYEFG